MSRLSEVVLWTFVVLIVVLCVNMDYGVYCSRASMLIDLANFRHAQEIEVAEIPSGNLESMAIERIDNTKCGLACGDVPVYEVMLPKARVIPTLSMTYDIKRKIVPGQYLGMDPKGRAVMIRACENLKLVYVLNRDNVAILNISSLLEAHKSHMIVYSIVGVDCGFNNLGFAAIELDYSESNQDSSGQVANEAQKHLTFYELDLGLNHVARKWSGPTENGANLLVTVARGGDGPSVVLVCAENFVIYKNQGHPDVRAVIPWRAYLPTKCGVLIVSTATHRQKAMFMISF